MGDRYIDWNIALQLPMRLLSAPPDWGLGGHPHGFRCALGPPHRSALRNSAKLLRLCGLTRYVVLAVSTWRKAPLPLLAAPHNEHPRLDVPAVTDRCGHDRACSSERTDDGEAIEHGQHTSFSMIDGQAGFYRRRTRSYVAIRREITRDFSKEGQRALHKRLGHITEVMWSTT
jgi:hypothetical protein